MRNNTEKKPFWGIPHLTLRAIILTALGSLLITASSMYVALKMSALPWPTIFVAILSMALLKLFGNTDLQEINVTQTGMSSGAMVAGGISFTLPGLWIAGIHATYDKSQGSLADWLLPKFWPVLLISLAGTLLGTLLCWYFRKRYIETNDLPYPIGTAAAETLKSGDEGGVKALILMVTLAVSAIFTVLRDRLRLIPELLGKAIGPLPFSLYLSPMAIGIGYIIGFAATIWWFVGAIFSHWLLAAGGVSWGWFPDATNASAFSFTAAIGLMVGSGVGILAKFVWSMIQNARRKSRAAAGEQGPKRLGRAGFIALLTTAAAFVLTVMAGLPPLTALLLMVGVLFATAMSATITGQTGINPMEIFGIIVLLFIRTILPVSGEQAFYIAAAVAVACGYAGDMLNDYKTGAILATNPDAQLVTQVVGGLIGTVVGSLALFAIIVQYGGVGGDTGLSAAQAFSVTAMVSGIGNTLVFGVAAAIGCVLYLVGIPAMIIGIGMILSVGMAVAIVLGGLASLLISRSRHRRAERQAIGNILSAGLLGGEGITGTILAIMAMLS